jgi:primosomal replication protein N
MNPRAWISVKDGAGTDWRIAVASPNAMLRQQWTRDSVKLGDQITVNGSLAKDGTKVAAAVTVYGSNGKRLFDSASVAEATPAEQDLLKAQQLMATAPLRKKLDEVQQRHEVLQQNGILRASVGSSEDYDSNAPISVTGVIVEVRMLNPKASIVMDATEGPAARYTFALTAPQNLVRLSGWTKGSMPKAGDKITVRGFLAVNSHSNDGSVLAMADTIVGIDGNRVFRVFDRTALQPAPLGVDSHTVDPNAYIIGTNDLLYVQVYNQPRFTRPVGVRPDGKITLPIIGDLQAAGLTPNKLRDQIKEAYGASELVNPIVDVTVTQVNSQK